jgi:RNA polymerase sigma-70 factor (ECF subfamily)
VNVVNTQARRARFEELAILLMEPLRRFLARRTDPDTAQDVLSETLLVCWRRLDEVPDDRLPWAYGVARHCLANAERARRRQSRLAARILALDPPAAAAAEPAEPPDERLHTALGRLRPLDVEIVRLWAWEDLGPAQIAAALELTPNAVSIRLHRARGRLRAELRKLGEGAGHDVPEEGRRP